MKPLYVIVNQFGIRQPSFGEFTSERAAKSAIWAVNKLCKREAKSGCMLVQYSVASMHPEMMETVKRTNEIIKNAGCGA